MRNIALKRVQKVFKREIDRFITVNGRPVTVMLPEIKTDCPNCLHDVVFNQDESTNRYNELFIRPVYIFPGTSEEEIVYPQPFNVAALPSGIVFDPVDPNPKILKTTICPVCAGRGYLSIKPVVCITANYNWDPRSPTTDGAIVDTSAGRSPANIGILKGHLKDYAICRDSIGFIVDGVECEMITPPTKRGVGSDAHIEIYLQKVDSSDATSYICDTDQRLNVRPVGEVSEQSDSGTPHSPPNTFSNGDW